MTYQKLLKSWYTNSKLVPKGSKNETEKVVKNLVFNKLLWFKVQPKILYKK